jgi:hypothetical protein
MSTVVATARARGAGACGRCGAPISRDDPIFKLDVGARGGSTRFGQGLGTWVGECCVHDLDAEPA